MSAGQAASSSGPKPTVDDVRLLWHSAYWDGPLNGLAEWRGRRWWFACDRDALPPKRVYYLYPLTADELEAEQERHEFFRRHVGEHTDYDQNGHRRVGAVRPQREWSLYYEVYPPASRPDYSDRAPVAGFVL